MSTNFQYTKVKALKYTRQWKIFYQSHLTHTGIVCVFSRFVDSNNKSFYEKCVVATHPSNEIDIRLMGYNAVFTYLETCLDKTGFLYSSCLLLCFERGLFDDDEDIRNKANSYLAKVINCGHGNNIFDIPIPIF